MMVEVTRTVPGSLGNGYPHCVELLMLIQGIYQITCWSCVPDFLIWDGRLCVSFGQKKQVASRFDCTT